MLYLSTYGVQRELVMVVCQAIMLPNTKDIEEKPRKKKLKLKRLARSHLKWIYLPGEQE